MYKKIALICKISICFVIKVAYSSSIHLVHLPWHAWWARPADEIRLPWVASSCQVSLPQHLWGGSAMGHHRGGNKVQEVRMTSLWVHMHSQLCWFIACPLLSVGNNAWWPLLGLLPWGLDYKVKSMLNSMLVNKDFLTWLLIGWWLCCQPIKCQVWKSWLTNMDFNIEISE